MSVATVKRLCSAISYPLDQSRDLAVFASEEQISFPVARHSTVFRCSRTLSDRHGINNTAVIALLSVMPRAPHHACALQVASNSFFKAPRDWMKSVR